MALGFVKLTEKTKHSEGAEHHRESGDHGHHEDKAKMASHNPVLIEQAGASQTSKLDGKGLRIAIVASHWYENVVRSLVDACSEELLAKGVPEDSLHLIEVAGAFELPFAAARLIDCKDKRHRPDAVICIGCIVKNSMYMCETMSQAVAHGIMKLNVTSATPVIFGVLCCDNESQAESCAEKRSCCGIDESQKCNHGVSWAQSALQMAHLKRCSSVKEIEQCCCTRCVGRRSGKGGEHKAEKQKASKHELKSSKQESCASCESTTNNCMCKDCKCRTCCVKRAACCGCGCPPDKCSCRGCNCAACGGKKLEAGKTSPSDIASKLEAVPSIERAEHEESLPGGAREHGSSAKCGSCGSPGGTCKCGLLH
ncbi:unnamed protein product [Peronospora belbahrii]|uniref:6,7-dimethyl-8-ribityllumazine synthase n=1 Tax=Peronospora belbahrii TaxID=622444 RepID=A0AAU9KXW3_9STRA|nr:unnamed protein product [Peronospora belbahrii]CAH0514238.1 unnamed protein product [Peronospora belbahrii]